MAAGIRPMLAIVFLGVLLGGTHAAQYFGKLIGKLSELHHGVSGEVYAVDSRTLYIKDFTYDGQGPAAYFYAGNARTPGSSGFRLRDENGSGDVIRKYRKEGVTITLPEGKTLNNIKIFYVWCEEYAVNFGDVKIPRNFDYPRPVKLDRLQGVHGISSDSIVIVDAQTLLIPNLSYDGEAPDAKFWAGRGPKPSPQGIRIPDENGKELPLRRINKRTVVITLPGDLTVFDIGHFGIWCEAFTVDFGHVQIPQNPNVPPSLKMLGVSPQSKLNCEVLHDSSAFEVRWALAGDSIVMQLVAKIAKGYYMSFGLSGDDRSSVMIGGDVAVAGIYKDSSLGYAVDYYLRDKSQCSGKTGSCPDTRFRENTNDIKLLNAATVNGYVIVTYQRPLLAQDEFDKTIYTNQTIPIIWAIGPLNERGEVSFHTAYLKKDQFIHFGRPSQWNCPAPEVEQPSMKSTSTDGSVQEETTPLSSRSRTSERRRGPNQNRGNEGTEAETSESERIPSRTRQQIGRRGSTRISTKVNAEEFEMETVKPVPSPAPVSKRNAWTIPPIQCYEPEDGVFYAQMGPTGGKRGYPAITGHVGWGISWYINGLLIPEINVVRGKTYTFVIEGGLDPDVPAKYHPFYITDDPVGGYEYRNSEERKNIKIFAGVRQDKDGNVYPTGTGRLCHWTQKGDIEADDFASFGAYQRSLELKCDQGEPGVIQWTPNLDTPDTVYYQCYTHRYLGWKINVLDSCDEQSEGSETVQVSVASPNAMNIKNKELEQTSFPGVDSMVKPYPISSEDLEDKVAYKISAIEDAVVAFPGKQSKMITNESPYISPQHSHYNPTTYIISNMPNYNHQTPFYIRNPFYEAIPIQDTFFKPQLNNFRPSPLIHTGLEQISNSASSTSVSSTESTTSYTTPSTTISTTTLSPITTSNITTTSGPKEHTTVTPSATTPVTSIINPSTKFYKNQHHPPMRTNFIKIPITTNNKKKPIRHTAALVRPSSHHNIKKPHLSIMHPASFHHPVKATFHTISNKPSLRVRPTIGHPYPNSPLRIMKQQPNVYLTKKPNSIIILTPQVQLVTKSPHALNSSLTVAKENRSSHDSTNFVSLKKTELNTSQDRHVTSGEQNALEIIYTAKPASIQPHQDSGFQPENIKIEKGFTPILERSDLLISKDDVGIQSSDNSILYKQPSFLKPAASLKKYEKYWKQSNPDYFKIKVKIGRNLWEKSEDPVAEASNKQIYYLPPDNQKKAPVSSVSQPSHIDIIPEESDLDTDVAPDVVVTYDGKKVSGASLTAKLADTTRLLEAKSLKTSEFIRTRPQSVPFKGELPPLESLITGRKPEFNIRASLNRNLDVPFPPDSNLHPNGQTSTKLSPFRTHSNTYTQSFRLRKKRSPHHTIEHTADQIKQETKSSCLSIKPPSFSLIVILLPVLLLLYGHQF
ncbi:hypothetical protein WA026_007230 [Henosepilachna vigintioctopunctata]|uniref:Protein Skeletor n=1 Tax=Henosepilachna vigintioctopunctata TaxID=420089 RepID=A0AAW1V3M6_9CUCU